MAPTFVIFIVMHGLATGGSRVSEAARASQLPQLSNSVLQSLRGGRDFAQRIEFRDRSQGSEFRVPGGMSPESMHSLVPDIGPLQYPYTMTTTGRDNRLVLGGGLVQDGLRAPTRIDHGQELEKQHSELYRMQDQLIKQRWMLSKARSYSDKLDAKLRADKAYLKHNKDTYRHFRANVLDNVASLGRAIDAIDPISEAYSKGNGFLAQFDRFSSALPPERKSHNAHPPEKDGGDDGNVE